MYPSITKSASAGTSRDAGGTCRRENVGPANGLEVNPRGQGPRAEADAARRLPHVSRAVRAACRRPSTAERAGSAGGPKPGRAGFYLELGGRRRQNYQRLQPNFGSKCGHESRTMRKG